MGFSERHVQHVANHSGRLVEHAGPLLQSMEPHQLPTFSILAQGS